MNITDEEERGCQNGIRKGGGREEKKGSGGGGVIDLQFTPLSHLARSFSTQKA